MPHLKAVIEIKIIKGRIKKVVDEVGENTDKNRIQEINKNMPVTVTAKVGPQTRNIDKSSKIKTEKELVIHTKTSSKIMLKRINKIILMANNKDTNIEEKAVERRAAQ